MEEKVDKKDENNSKSLSDERHKSKQKENSSTNHEKKLKEKIPKNRFTPNKRKRIVMYLILVFFLLLSLICLILTHFYLEENITKILNKNRNFYILLFITSIVSSLIISSIASYCECLMKTHLFGILLFIILSILNNYCIIYSIIIVNYFEQLFCALVILVSGSFGLFINILIVKDENPSLFILFIFNGIFSFISGCIMCFIYNNLWNILFSFLAFIISEFNIYSSQYQFCKKKKKKEPLIYSQPFELIISIFKLFYFVMFIFIRLIKVFCKIIKKTLKNKSKKKTNDVISNQGQNKDEEKGIETEEPVGQEQKGGEVKIHDQSQG